MIWIKTFYEKQNELSNAYFGEISEYEYSRVAAIEQLAGPGKKRVLELGAGGGQSAAATADAGHDVTAIEIVHSFVEHARQLATKKWQGTMTVIEGDFYTVEVSGTFDVVCYWDGFGVGSDADQKRLLTRIASWFTQDGCALIDINTPWYWAIQANGQEMHTDQWTRRYGFDAAECRMLDSWWPANDETQAVTQSLRCYSPADLKLLLEETGLSLETYESGGAVDYQARQYCEHVQLEQAMQYRAKLVHAHL